MGRETPEDILFGSYRPQVQPVAVDIFKLAYLPLFNQFLYLPCPSGEFLGSALDIGHNGGRCYLTALLQNME